MADPGPGSDRHGRVGYVLGRRLPGDITLLLTYDCGVAVYIAPFCMLVGRASPEDAAEISRRGEPNGRSMLLGVVALSVVSLVGVAAMLNHPTDRPRWVTNLHLGTSLLVVILSSITVAQYAFLAWDDSQ